MKNPWRSQGSNLRHQIVECPYQHPPWSPVSIGKPAPKIHQWTIYFCRWGFVWVDKAQCFRSARRFGAAGSSPDFSRGFSRHGAPSPLSWTFFQCTLLSYPGQPSFSHFLVIFGRRALIFFVWKLSEKNEKWHHFCAHAQWWSPWRRKNVENGHLVPSNLTFLLFAIGRNGFDGMKEEGQIYKGLPQIF